MPDRPCRVHDTPCEKKMMRFPRWLSITAFYRLQWSLSSDLGRGDEMKWKSSSHAPHQRLHQKNPQAHENGLSLRSQNSRRTSRSPERTAFMLYFRAKGIADSALSWLYCTLQLCSTRQERVRESSCTTMRPFRNSWLLGLCLQVLARNSGFMRQSPPQKQLLLLLRLARRDGGGVHLDLIDRTSVKLLPSGTRFPSVPASTRYERHLRPVAQHLYVHHLRVCQMTNMWSMFYVTKRHVSTNLLDLSSSTIVLSSCFYCCTASRVWNLWREPHAERWSLQLMRIRDLLRSVNHVFETSSSCSSLSSLLSMRTVVPALSLHLQPSPKWWLEISQDISSHPPQSTNQETFLFSLHVYLKLSSVDELLYLSCYSSY